MSGWSEKQAAAGGVQWLEPIWPAPARVRSAVSLRAGGVSAAPYDTLNLGDHVGDEPVAVAENRRRLSAALNLPAEPRWLRQVHGTQVVEIAGDEPAAPEADASLARRAGAVCAILTADCLPVLLCDDTGQCVAAAHAGWRGLCAGVLENTVRAMRVAPSTLMAWLGPAIGPRAFEVGAEVRAAFMAHDASAESAFAPAAAQKYVADLYLLARQRLAAAGVLRVHGGGACTHDDALRFYSHRRDARSGRLASLIWIDKTE